MNLIKVYMSFNDYYLLVIHVTYHFDQQYIEY